MSAVQMDNNLHVEFTDGEVQWVDLNSWEWKDLGPVQRASDKQVEEEEEEEEEELSEDEPAEIESSSDGEADIDPQELLNEMISLYFAAGHRGWWNGKVMEVGPTEIKVEWEDNTGTMWVIHIHSGLLELKKQNGCARRP